MHDSPDSSSPPPENENPAVLRAILRRYDTADQLTQGLLHRLIQAWLTFTRRDLQQSASLAYYAVLSIFPLLLLVITTASSLLSPDVIEQLALRLAQRFFPGDTQTVIVSSIASVFEQKASLNVLTAVGLLWAGSSLFSNLSTALDTIFETVKRPLWRKRILGFSMVVTLALVLAVFVIASVSLRFIGSTILEYPGLLMRALSILIPLALDMAVLTLLFRYVPQPDIRWKAIWPAALVGSIGWEFIRGLFVWYVDNLANYHVVYGPLETIIALLIWAYLSAAVLLLSAEICAAVNNWLAERQAAPLSK